MLKHLLDTHIAVYVVKRRPKEVAGVFGENAGRMVISTITLSRPQGLARASTWPPEWVSRQLRRVGRKWPWR